MGLRQLARMWRMEQMEHNAWHQNKLNKTSSVKQLFLGSAELNQMEQVFYEHGRSALASEIPQAQNELQMDPILSQ